MSATANLNQQVSHLEVPTEQVDVLAQGQASGQGLAIGQASVHGMAIGQPSGQMVGQVSGPILGPQHSEQAQEQVQDKSAAALQDAVPVAQVSEQYFPSTRILVFS